MGYIPLNGRVEMIYLTTSQLMYVGDDELDLERVSLTNKMAAGTLSMWNNVSWYQRKEHSACDIIYQAKPVKCQQMKGQ